jgi:hypothetical protein
MARSFFKQKERNGSVIKDIAQYYVRNNDGNMVPLSSLLKTRNILGPEYTNRFQPLSRSSGHRHRRLQVIAQDKALSGS